MGQSCIQGSCFLLPSGATPSSLSLLLCPTRSIIWGCLWSGASLLASSPRDQGQAPPSLLERCFRILTCKEPTTSTLSPTTPWHLGAAPPHFLLLS